MARIDIWTYREAGVSGTACTGYEVEALDGSIGKIDEANDEVGAAYLVVDTGPWIFGKKVMLPAGVVDRVDHDREKVFVDQTKEEIKDAPELDEQQYRGEEYRNELSGYYTGIDPAKRKGPGQL